MHYYDASIGWLICVCAGFIFFGRGGGSRYQQVGDCQRQLVWGAVCSCRRWSRSSKCRYSCGPDGFGKGAWQCDSSAARHRLCCKSTAVPDLGIYAVLDCSEEDSALQQARLGMTIRCYILWLIVMLKISMCFCLICKFFAIHCIVRREECVQLRESSDVAENSSVSVF